jgi:hypothetical protein
LPRISLYISKDTVGGKYAAIARLEQGSFRKVFAHCLSSTIEFERIFDEAIQALKKPCEILLFSNFKPFDVHCAVMKESLKGVHKITFAEKTPSDTLERLKWIAYEIALNKGVDGFTINEALGDWVK